MAVAIERLGTELRKATAKVAQVKKPTAVKKPKVKLTKFYGQCEMPDGSVTFIVAKAVDISDVSAQLHRGYKIAMLLDILTADEMDRVWARLKPSNVQRPVLK